MEESNTRTLPRWMFLFLSIGGAWGFWDLHRQDDG